MMDEITCVWAANAQLGEGPMFSAVERALWFVDIKGPRVHRYEEASGEHSSWDAPEPVGFVLPTSEGRLVCGLQSGLYDFDPATATYTLIEPVEPDRPGNRLNDACVDTAGRLWFGTMDDAEQQPTGALYRFDSRGLQCCEEPYVITNGPAVSPDGRTFYHVDTLKREILAFDLDADGELSNRRVFAHVPADAGYPDGTAVDAAGHLWVALHGGWSLQRYSPAGRPLESVRLPVANCTKMAFGGADLRTLYVTSAWNGLSDADRIRQPLAGGLFRVRIDEPGLPQRQLRL